MQLQHLDKQKKGFASLVAVSVLAVVGGGVGAALLVLSADAAYYSNTVYLGVQAQALAHSCAEVALDKLKSDGNYAGNETIAIGSNSCQILAVVGSGNTNRTISTTATVNNVIRKETISIAKLRPTTEITSWQEVAN